ncbi:hypothetical protein [Stackebrandtia nassauensis]|uniref:Uncharacterized protein n=1 Tax=Stackebrandtia nassauensis (strain DSM 44728 / CIP 108903 / NRRL B-16338 / NBRC 102104 / LLR-40K-21) TaxID=446470 RepID=D3PYD8_STANL|nr:hypothetical protein [Stackebrandtia nassauensis]ADD41505.1 hypothetical protein Snas_1809 [Stackebrandtia nassauensis DSM 44728]
MPNLPSNDELDALVEELFSTLGNERTGDDFHFDPESLSESTRFYYVDFLKWLGIDDSVLEAERICIHAGREQPANLDRRRINESGVDGYSLFIDNSLYRSLDAVYAALAHQFTHLRLIIDEDQTLAEAQKCRPIELDTKGKKDDDDDDDDDDEKDTKPAVNADLEIRTEVASFVLGFGKLVLNGAAEWDELDIDDDEGFEDITTLPLSSLAYLYKKVANHADVGTKAMEAGLTDEAKEALGKVKSKK